MTGRKKPWPRQSCRLPEPLQLECGRSLGEVAVAYETWGHRQPEGDRVAVALHALSGSSHMAPTEAFPEPGWWDVLVAPGGPFDPRHWHVICPNLLGGCYGTTGPSSIDRGTGRPHGASFPQITIGDMVEAHRALLRELGITGPVTLVGGSMGGMLALEWAAVYPKEVQALLSLCAPGKAFAQAIAFRAMQREAIMRDPKWRGGNYPLDDGPADGLALARKIGMITYRSDLEFNIRFGRKTRKDRLHFLEGSFEVQEYLHHQGHKFVERFDANSYLYFSRAMDIWSLENGCESFAQGVARIEAPTLLVAVDSDILCPPYQTEELRDMLREHDRDVTYRVIHSPRGHDAFLIETEQVARMLSAFLAKKGLGPR